MDTAYDHVHEEALSPNEEEHEERPASERSTQTLNADLQQAFTAVSSSPWGATLGGWFSSARKQGESFVQELQRDAQEVQEQATKGFTSLREQVVNRTRSLSLNAQPGPAGQVSGDEAESSTAKAAATSEAHATQSTEKPLSLPADIVKEAGSLVASLRTTAAAKLRDLQKAEDAADEALLQFGNNIRNFLRDAVVISAPTAADSGKRKGTDAVGNEVLFETQEPGTRKKIFHSTRLDAQLHAVHTTAATFTEDPQSSQWEEWESRFDIDKQTAAVAGDLDRYEELRRAMEKLVPEKVEYKTFWVRYYFLRKAMEEEEKRRKEVLKGAASTPTEQVAWDDDDDEQQASTPVKPSNESTITLNAPPRTSRTLKPNSPPRSNEGGSSVAGSEASYDLVSGAVSRAGGSPREDTKKEESDDDWE